MYNTEQINKKHLNTSDMSAQCFHHNFSYIYIYYIYILYKYIVYILYIYILYIYILFALAYLCIAWHIPPQIPFLTINNISLSVNNSNFTPVFFTQVYHANPGADKKLAGSSSYISIHFFLKFSDTSVNNNVSLWTYKSR